MRESSKLKEGGKTTVLGIQHVFAMFGSTILVPILTGLPVSVALFCAGIGTLIFHLVTKGKVPFSLVQVLHLLLQFRSFLQLKELSLQQAVL